jgi:curved DNA-binding protein
MEDYYQILRINQSATEAEVRRAYRILARRYHPDVNPGKDSAMRFRLVAEAYGILRDPEKRKHYDLELESYQRRNLRNSLKSYRENFRRAATKRYYEAQKADYDQIKQWQKAAADEPPEAPEHRSLKEILARWAFQPVHLSTLTNGVKRFGRWVIAACALPEQASTITKVSIIEISVTIPDALKGVRKTVEVEEPEGVRKINVRVPAGVRNGSIIRLRSQSTPEEELILVTRIAKHPFLSIEPKGLTMEVPITVNEAIAGASIAVPTLEEPAVLKIPANTQSGAEFRLKKRGIPGKDERGDLFVRVMVHVPESANAVGIKDKSADLDKYYEQDVRRHLPKSLLES